MGGLQCCRTSHHLIARTNHCNLSQHNRVLLATIATVCLAHVPEAERFRTCANRLQLIGRQGEAERFRTCANRLQLIGRQGEAERFRTCANRLQLIGRQGENSLSSPLHSTTHRFFLFLTQQLSYTYIYIYIYIIKVI